MEHNDNLSPNFLSIHPSNLPPSIHPSHKHMSIFHPEPGIGPPVSLPPHPSPLFSASSITKGLDHPPAAPPCPAPASSLGRQVQHALHGVQPGGVEVQGIALHSDGLQPLGHTPVGDPVGAAQAGQAKGHPAGRGGDPLVACNGRCRAFLKLGLSLRACAAGLQAGCLTQIT